MFTKRHPQTLLRGRSKGWTCWRDSRMQSPSIFHRICWGKCTSLKNTRQRDSLGEVLWQPIRLSLCDTHIFLLADLNTMERSMNNACRSWRCSRHWSSLAERMLSIVSVKIGIHIDSGVISLTATYSESLLSRSHKHILPAIDSNETFAPCEGVFLCPCIATESHESPPCS